jgi:2-oxoglutarate ferredoxin oxidoreductase subunit beta
MGPPNFPTPVGVFRSIDKPIYDQLLMEQIREAEAQQDPDINALYRQGQTWEVS